MEWCFGLGDPIRALEYKLINFTGANDACEYESPVRTLYAGRARSNMNHTNTCAWMDVARKHWKILCELML